RSFGGGSLMVWGAIAGDEKVLLAEVNGNLDSEGYEILAEDTRVKDFFGKGVLERIKQPQTTVLVELLGGPKVYQGRDLPAIHKTLGVTDYHFDAFIMDFDKALSGAGLDSDLIDEVVITLEPLRDVILGRDPGESALAQQMKQKNGKPVVERLGGDMNLETIVEGMYEKAQVDDRLKFFLDKGKQKIRQIKQKMYQLICGALGGPKLYDIAKLKPAHYNMNITNYHFDAILNCFSEMCREMGIDADTTDDACLILNSVRGDITTGCSVRMELAKRRSQLDGDDQLFARLGGLEGVEDVVSRLYECVERDKRINNFFTGAKLQAIKRSQSDFIIKTLGGPTNYSGRTLEEIHAVLAITDFHLDVFFQLMARSLRDCGHDGDTVDEVLVRLEDLRKHILAAHYEKKGYVVRMADIVGLITNVERAHNDLQQLRTKMASVTGKLEAIKQQVGPTAGGGADGTTPINAHYVQSELSRARETLDRFMTMVREQAEKQDATSADDELIEAEATMETLRKKMTGTDDKTRPLIERLGGDTAIETCVKLAYAQAMKDPRTKAYFYKNKRKMTSIKKKMHQYLAGAFGGASTYDEEDLKNAHYQLNITDFHFDAVAEMFHETFVATGAHANAVRDAMKVLAATRKDITTGCTVRMELARRSTEKGLDALFRRLGEEAGIVEFVDRLYDLLVGDKRVLPYFEGKDVWAIKQKQLVYITFLLGGPKAYQGRDLAEIHEGLGIDDYGFDCFTMNCEKALAAMGVDEDTIDEIIVTIEPLRDEVLNRKRGLRAETKIVDGQSILQRIGGEMNLEAVVETMFSGCVVDPRVKYFFTKEPGKLGGIQAKLVQLLTGLMGGPKTYDYARLRPAHYNLNITDYQFDAVVENLQVACSMMEVSDVVIADITEVISTLRSYITCGCVVRYEIARKKTEAAGTEGLFNQLGQDEGITKFMDFLYDLVTQDDRIKHFFQGAKLDAVKESQSVYFKELFGSSTHYTGRDIPSIHSLIQISDFHFDSFLDSAKIALAKLGMDTDTIDDCIVLMESARKKVVNPELMNHDVKKAMELANKKPLYDRLGGEYTITKLMESTYDKALEDDRLRFYFEKNKAKVTSIKKKMTQFVSGLTGGPSGYDIHDLKPAHYSMNISNFHFDTMLGLLAQTIIEDLKVEKPVARELMSLLQPVRADITTGYTVRSEMARKNIEKGLDHLFERMGARDGILKLLDSLYQLVAGDPRIKDFFGDGALEKIREGQTIVLVELFGGPKVYNGRDLAEIHKNLNVTDYHFDCFCADFQKAMMGLGMDENLIDEVLITMEPLRLTILGRDGNEAALAAQMKVKDGKSVMERLGGDMNLEALVESMFDKAMTDDRIKFFLDKGKAKVRNLKQKMYQFMSGAFGGPKQYDPAAIKPAHYNMNITDFHVDAMLDCFSDTCQEMDIDPDTIDDAIMVMNSVRSDITTGFALRRELAQKRDGQDGEDQLFARLGGLEGVEEFVTRLYECVERDRRINQFFTGAKLKAIKQAQTDYIIKALGGPSDYTGRSLEEIHAVLAITDYHLDCFLQLVSRALRDCGQDQETVDEVVVKLGSLRGSILKAYYAKMGYTAK
ncbi:hypothetical protein FOL47_002717, partial [Perkinsus chesapeaki]